MDVTFKTNELLNGFTLNENGFDKNGVDSFIAENDNYIIYFISEAGSGRNYSNCTGYTDKNSCRNYSAGRFTLKFVSTVQGFSNQLFKKWLKTNSLKVSDRGEIIHK